MSKRYHRYWIVILLILYSSISFAVSPKLPPKPDDLKHLDQQIQQLQQEIQHDKGQKGHLAQQLKANATKLTKLEKQLATLKVELKKQKNNLVNLQQQQTLCKQQVCQQQSLLMKHVVAVYFLLNQGANKRFSLSDQERYLTYLKYCNTTHLDNLQRLQQQYQTLCSKQQQVISHKDEVQTVLSKRQKSQHQLVAAKQNQQQVLTVLALQIDHKNAKLSQLQANRHALEQLVKKLSQMQQVKPQAPPSVGVLQPTTESFAKSQGKLFWPIAGPIISPYGAAIAQSELKNTGVLIGTHTKQPVMAIAQGKVIFANWLQGLGLLLIIDHGDGYMSLYGHNQALYKKVGDKVKSREQVATVGKETEHSGLYFEIRHNGQAVNPEQWCR